MLIRLLVVLLITASAARSATSPRKSGAAANPPAERALTPKEVDARRTALAVIIAAEQKVMDRYEKQSSFKKKDDLYWVTEAQYAAAKARRDKAQAERNALANRS
ncbi:MAG: hypothetical protein NTV51_12865 [Verrucomicrobia bacterium]|nr:hypothetical protein [Verrucomicrobiota bacterium]